jgi:mRNA interferase MazF
MEALKRGDIVLVALSGDYGKPRPALVVQSDLFNENHPSITVLPITSELRSTPLFRITVEPAPSNGLRMLSQIMVDKPTTARRERVREVIGHLDDLLQTRVNRSLLVWLGLP